MKTIQIKAKASTSGMKMDPIQRAIWKTAAFEVARQSELYSTAEEIAEGWIKTLEYRKSTVIDVKEFFVGLDDFMESSKKAWNVLDEDGIPDPAIVTQFLLHAYGNGMFVEDNAEVMDVFEYTYKVALYVPDLIMQWDPELWEDCTEDEIIEDFKRNMCNY